MNQTPNSSTQPGPRVSVVIPLKNRRELVRETLASIQQQTCPLWEAVVVDDGSTDGSAEAVAALATTDDRIRILHRQGSQAGAPVCRNQGFQASVAPLIIFLDSDDLLMPTCLEQRLRVMDANPSLAYAAFVTEIFNEKPGDVGLYWNGFNDEDDLDRFLRVDPPWQTSGPIWRREALHRIGPWDESATKWQDWEFHMRALALRLPYRKVSVADQLWRATRGDSISHTRNSAEALMLVELIARIRRVLDAAGQLNPQRDRVFAGLYESLMRPYLYQPEGGVARGTRLWRACRRSGIIGWSRYLRGLWWLALRRTPVIRWKIDRPMWAFFSEERLIGSKTHLRATAPDLAASGDGGIDKPSAAPGLPLEVQHR